MYRVNLYSFTFNALLVPNMTDGLLSNEFLCNISLRHGATTLCMCTVPSLAKGYVISDIIFFLFFLMNILIMLVF